MVAAVALLGKGDWKSLDRMVGTLLSKTPVIAGWQASRQAAAVRLGLLGSHGGGSEGGREGEREAAVATAGSSLELVIALADCSQGA